MIDYDAHRWRHHFFDVRGSMLREIVYRVLACVAWSAGVVAVHRWVVPIGVPSTVHALVGVALGLLLVFRTNASYDRFWEGRKLWGGIVNETRNLARAARPLFADAPALYTELVRWTQAFPYATMHSLRGGVGLGPVAHHLPAEVLDTTQRAQHVPLAVAARLSACLDGARRRGVISDFAQMTLDQNVQQLIDYVGACERIHKTPLPFAYVVHLRRALVLYCFSLPFALVRDYGWATVFDVLCVAYVFFGIEEIGVEIEDPFGNDDNDLPLERICGTIHGNLEGLLEGVATPSV